MAKAQIYLVMEIVIKVSINMENQMDLDNINGVMAVFMLESLKMV